MKFHHFYRGIIIRLLGLIIASGLTVYLYFVTKNIAYSLVTFFVAIIFIVNTIYYFNNINQWIAFFLLGIENEDTSLRIPTQTGNKAIDEVFEGMSRLNELFKQTKVEINTQEQYYRSIINQSATGLFSVNGQGRITITNPAAEKLTGIIPYHHINSLTRINSALPGFIMQNNNGKTASVIFENDKAQKLLFKISCIYTTNQTIRLVAVSDITKELDNREVDAWIKLARTLSHEIMNNITPITTLSKVIQSYFVKNGATLQAHNVEQKIIDNTVKGLAVIEERSSGLMTFVENYRKFTKLPEPQFKQIKLESFINNNLLICSEFDPNNNILIQKHIDENIICNVDENFLSQVFINLVKNAIESINEQQQTTNPTIIIKSSVNNNYTCLSVANTGAAIPAELREQIFVPFFTTKEQGSGIGLSLSKQLMLKMGGDLILDTNPNFVTFVIRF